MSNWDLTHLNLICNIRWFSIFCYNSIHIKIFFISLFNLFYLICLIFFIISSRIYCIIYEFRLWYLFYKFIISNFWYIFFGSIGFLCILIIKNNFWYIFFGSMGFLCILIINNRLLLYIFCVIYYIFSYIFRFILGYKFYFIGRVYLCRNIFFYFLHRLFDDFLLFLINNWFLDNNLFRFFNYYLY